MRRAVLAVIGTVAGTALMVGAKLGTPRPDDPAAATATDDGPVSSAPPGPAPASAPPAAATASAGPPAPGQSPGRPAPAPPPTTPPAGGGLKNGTFTGNGAPARHYEVVTVTITVSGGRITVADGSCGNASGEPINHVTKRCRRHARDPGERDARSSQDVGDAGDHFVLEAPLP